MTSWVFALFDSLGAAGVGLLIFLDNFFPLISSEVVLPLAGFRARTGTVDPVLVWPAATIAAVAGSLVYYLGVWLGYDRLHALAGRLHPGRCRRHAGAPVPGAHYHRLRHLERPAHRPGLVPG